MKRLLLAGLLLAPLSVRADDAAELAKAIRDARAAVHAERKAYPQGKSGPYARLPTWELGANVAQKAFSGPETPLTDREKAIAVWVFGEGTIDLEAVRVVSGATTTGTPMVLGNTLRIPSGVKFSTGAIAHELTHIWQYQTSGTSYISDSFLKQACAYLETGDRDNAYKYAIVPGKRFVEYSSEQQAEIVEAWALNSKKRADPEYQRLISELRASKAPRRFTPEHAAVMMEKDAGLPSRWRALPPSPGDPGFNNEAGGVPQFELRF